MRLKYGISNLRRLKNVAPIEIRPITILVGRNSSGKSTYLRSLALLSQSITTRTSSPILWYGDLVDFGSYDVSISDTNHPITFSSSTDTLIQTDYRPGFRYPTNLHERLRYRDLKYTVVIVPIGPQTRIKSVTLSVDSLSLAYTIYVNDKNAIDSVLINGKEAKYTTAGISLNISPGSIFPEMHALRKREDVPALPTIAYYRRSVRDRIPETIESFLRKHLSKKISAAKFFELTDYVLGHFPASETDLFPKSIKYTSSIASWKRLVDKIGSDENIRRDFVSAIYLAQLPDIFNRMTLTLKSIVTRSLYIGPARARSDRYYRYQDLSVSEIDPDGKNFPMFLNSLSPDQVEELSVWIEGLFGYGLNVSRTEGAGHLSINLVEHGFNVNIVDTGYGVSQILPVLAQIWWARERAVIPQAPLRVRLLCPHDPCNRATGTSPASGPSGVIG